MFNDPKRLEESDNFFIILRKNLISFATTKCQIASMIQHGFEMSFDEKREFKKSDRWQILRKARMFRPKTAFTGNDPKLFQKLE